MQDLSGVRILFHADWSDGPVSGMAEYEGHEYWYEAVWDDATDDWTTPRRFRLVRLSDDELAEEWRIHREFERHVGTLHCEHLDVTKRVQRPRNQWARFYDDFPAGHRDRHTNAFEIGSFTL